MRLTQAGDYAARAVIATIGLFALVLWLRHIAFWTPRTMSHALSATFIAVVLTLAKSGVQRVVG
jgi:hypothetical protein